MSVAKGSKLSVDGGIATKRKLSTESDSKDELTKQLKLDDSPVSNLEEESEIDLAEEIYNQFLSVPDSSDEIDPAAEEIYQKFITLSENSPEVKPRFNRRCEPCNKRFHSAKNYFHHLESPIHVRRTTPKQVFECKTCNRTFDSNQYKFHLESKFHKSNLLSFCVGQKLGIDKPIPPVKGSKSKCKIFCQLCDKQFNNLVDFDRHISSTIHNRIYKHKGKVKYAECTVCDVQFRYHLIESHKTDPNHINNMQKLLLSKTLNSTQEDSLEGKANEINLLNVTSEETCDLNEAALMTGETSKASEVPTSDPYCKLCKMRFEGKNVYEKHLVSKEHNRIVPNNKQRYTFYCIVCTKKVLRASVNLHISSPCHANNMKILIDSKTNFHKYKP